MHFLCQSLVKIMPPHMLMIAALKICEKNQNLVLVAFSYLAISIMHQIVNWHRFCLSGLGVLLDRAGSNRQSKTFKCLKT